MAGERETWELPFSVGNDLTEGFMCRPNKNTAA